MTNYVFSDDKTGCERIGLILDASFRPSSGGSLRFTVPADWQIAEERRAWGSRNTGGYYTRLVLTRPDGGKWVYTPGDCHSRPRVSVLS
jgi:hypothetical protein